MLKSNLSTRPFYNERRVHVAAAIVALIVVAFTAWNVTRLVALSSRRTELRAQNTADEARAQQLRAEAQRMEKSVDPAALVRVASAAREANAIVYRRTFSWTTFFNRLEATLPPGVMLMSVAPQVENGQVIVTMVVMARRVADVDDFMVRLEGSGGFKDVNMQNDTVTDAGLHRVALRGRYE